VIMGMKIWSAKLEQSALAGRALPSRPFASCRVTQDNIPGNGFLFDKSLDGSLYEVSAGLLLFIKA
jgi:hypothetical protein